MYDFFMVSHSVNRSGKVEVYPVFIIDDTKDLMIKGGKFYAVWDEGTGLWSKKQGTAIRVMDRELRKYAESLPEYQMDPSRVSVKYFRTNHTGSIDKWHKFIQRQMWDQFEPLDKNVIFADKETKREDYATMKLPYIMADGSIECYDKLMSTLYNREERRKLEWAIGSIIAGDSKHIQKFVVLYGEAGSGKGTFLQIVQKLFDGYCESFDSKKIGSAGNQFAIEAFKDNPLVAIDMDGDLSKLDDNTKLNTIVSHEYMEMNEKFKSPYPIKIDSFLFIGSNRPVKITEAKSGLLRRLIDVNPSGNLVPQKAYHNLMDGVEFELGAIAKHCYDVYNELGEYYYSDYVPKQMLQVTNDFYDFVENYYSEFAEKDMVQLKDVWETYKKYCEYAQMKYSMNMRAMRSELKNYFREYKEDTVIDGRHMRNVYIGFRKEKFFYKDDETKEVPDYDKWIYLEEQVSLFDQLCKSCYAQYANKQEIPMAKWSDVETRLEDLDTSLIHYVMLPSHHIVIDFDLKDEHGNKSLELNLREANKWPKTYAEVSKGGEGIHLHYFYHGDVDELSRVYKEGIEIKIFNGNASLRRRLSKCNDIPIATISSGLPLKGAKKMVDFDGIKNEKGLRTIIQDCLEKKHHGATKPEVDFIYKVLEDAYKSGMEYDVTDLRTKILSFASKSSNQSAYCVKLVSKMKFCSEKVNSAEDTIDSEGPMVIYDVEVFKNLLLICWKIYHDDTIHRMFNPSPMDVEKLTKYRLVGFNNRKYDNHILYARILGYDEYQIYELSQKIISSDKNSRNAMFSGAYNLSYTDVLDFASAGNKKSLKKWEIELGIPHKELGLPWDQPVDESLWPLVADYCDNDVRATEAVFDHLKADWTARQILADIAGMSVNSSTNSLTTKIVFGNDRKPQSQFKYRNMAEPVPELEPDVQGFLEKACPEMIPFNEHSLIPYFPGYTFDAGKSVYQDIEVGEGGYVYSEPGVYGNVALLDVSSMHPHSLIAECLFGVEYTNHFRDIVEGRVSIKHEDWKAVSKMMDGKLKPYIEKVKNGEMKSKDLANALKTAINSVYGLTKARFDNPFRDPNNKDNIVAKRGALFMVDLLKEVQSRGYTVAHIKTDSIKIPDADEEIVKIVSEIGRRYGYEFEHEATYDKLCLINKADYIAKYQDGEHEYQLSTGEKIKTAWTATGKQFSEPYVFKTLFSHSKIKFEDYCQTKEVKTGDIYIDMNENLAEGEHDYQFVGRIGSFVPIKPGHGGGELFCLRDGKYDAVAGTKGYRWLEAETVKSQNREKDIDESYFIKLVDDMAKCIQDLCTDADFEWFLSEDMYDGRFDLPF